MFSEYNLTFIKKKKTVKTKENRMYKSIENTSLRTKSTKTTENTMSKQLNRTHFLV